MSGIDFSVTISGRPHVLHILLPAVVIISWCDHVTSGRDRAGVYGLRLRVAAWLRPRRSLRVNAGGRRPLSALDLDLDPTQPNMDRPNPWPCLTAGGLYPAWLETYTAVSNCLVVFNAAVNILLIYQPPSCYRLDRPLSKSSSSLACLSTSS